IRKEDARPGPAELGPARGGTGVSVDPRRRVPLACPPGTPCASRQARAAEEKYPTTPPTSFGRHRGLQVQPPGYFGGPAAGDRVRPRNHTARGPYPRDQIPLRQERAG